MREFETMAAILHRLRPRSVGCFIIFFICFKARAHDHYESTFCQCVADERLCCFMEKEHSVGQFSSQPVLCGRSTFRQQSTSNFFWDNGFTPSNNTAIATYLLYSTPTPKGSSICNKHSFSPVFQSILEYQRQRQS